MRPKNQFDKNGRCFIIVFNRINNKEPRPIHKRNEMSETTKSMLALQHLIETRENRLRREKTFLNSRGIPFAFICAEL